MKAALKQLLALAIPCWLLLPIAQATQRSPGSFVPIGGGYTQASLKGFARVVVNAAPGRDIKILVVPTAYGDNPNERQANLQLARNRTALIQSACGAVLQAPAMRCTAQLVPLLDRADALNRDNSALFSAPDVAGVFFLGGDQDVAMRVMAGSPVESAMQAAHERGVAFGGTSAGDSVESRNMVAGYSPGFDDTSELDQGAVSVWWADGGDGQRGLAFGLPGVLLDQHFYQRGRFGRLINMVAQSAAHYHDHGLLGMGFDFGTGAEVRAGGLLTGIFGSSSVAIVDFRTAN
ncbi:MAG: cyanophycinase, partial [Rhodanobacteraceae bacterium]